MHCIVFKRKKIVTSFNINNYLISHFSNKEFIILLDGWKEIWKINAVRAAELKMKYLRAGMKVETSKSLSENVLCSDFGDKSNVYTCK